MKKRFLFGLLVSIFALVGFTACGEPKMSAVFDKEEYIISVGDDIDVFDCVELNNIDEEKVTLQLTNTNIAYIQDGFLHASFSGQTYLMIKYNNTTLASVKVFIRYKLAGPRNLEINQTNGTLTWDKSYVTIDGKL